MEMARSLAEQTSPLHSEHEMSFLVAVNSVGLTLGGCRLYCAGLLFVRLLRVMQEGIYRQRQLK